MPTSASVDTYGAGCEQAPLNATLTPSRLFRYSGAPPVAALCGSGVAADGVTDILRQYTDNNPTTGTVHTQPTIYGLFAIRGQPVLVETGGAFASGANLQSDASGRAISYSSGPVVLRALEASSGSGFIVWAVFA